MVWSFKEDRPIYSQLVEQIKINIVSGEWALGSKLPSVRDLAEQAGVNPNTMQRALSDLEREGLVYSKRTSGRFITEDEKMTQNVREAIAAENINVFVESMKMLGFTPDETLHVFEKAIKGGESK
ncbi:MAG: GntR family transcriptional regulator [Candidatus Metalachnospira sp.]|nr:GntR family transcriptional regulator [Candidatus Metalachnospira sp.]